MFPRVPKVKHPLVDDQDEARRLALEETGIDPSMIDLPDFTAAFESLPEPSSAPLPAAPEPLKALPPVEAPPQVDTAQSLKAQIDESLKLLPKRDVASEHFDKARAILYGMGVNKPVDSSLFTAPDSDEEIRRKLALAVATKRLAAAQGGGRALNPNDDPNSPASMAARELAASMGEVVPTTATANVVNRHLMAKRLQGTATSMIKHREEQQKATTERLRQNKIATSVRINEAMRHGQKDIAVSMARRADDMEKLGADDAVGAFEEMEKLAPGSTDLDMGRVLSGVSPELRAKAGSFTNWSTLMNSVPEFKSALGQMAETVTRQGINLASPDFIHAMDRQWQRLKAAERKRLFGATLTPGEMAAADRLFQEGLRGNPAIAFAVMSEMKKKLYRSMLTIDNSVSQLQGGAEALAGLEELGGITSFNNVFRGLQGGGLSIRGTPLDYSEEKAALGSLDAAPEVEAAPVISTEPVVREPARIPSISPAAPPRVKPRASNTIKMVDPDGDVHDVPASEVDLAKRKGLKLVK